MSGRREPILVLAPLGGALHGGLQDALDARYRVVSDAASALAREVRVVVTTGGQGVEPTLMERLPLLELIAVFGVGVDRIDVAGATRRGIAVATTPDVLTDDVADMAVALLYAAARRVAANDRLVRAGGWARTEAFGTRLTGRRIGIVGLGRIGGAIARRLEPVAGAIAYHNRRPLAGCGYAYHDSAEALARASDVLILAAAGAAGTPPIVTAAALDALGPDGLFVNVARGAAVDEEALVRALVERRILGAGLDVVATEPQVDPALLALDQVTLSPHQGSATQTTREAMAELVLANIAAFLAGDPLPTAATGDRQGQPTT